LFTLDRTDIHVFGNLKKDAFDSRFTIFLHELFVSTFFKIVPFSFRLKDY